MPRSSVSDTTVLEFFRRTRPSVRVESWERLAAAGTNGVDRMIAMDPTSENLKLLMPLEFRMQPPQIRNMAFVINCWIKTGGVISPYPKSIAFGDGI